MIRTWHRSVPTPRSAPAGRGRRAVVGPSDEVDESGRPGGLRPFRAFAGRTAVAFLLAAVSLATAPRPMTAQEESSVGQLEHVRHAYDGVERSYRLLLPEAAPEDGRALVVMLHGCTQDGDDFATGTRMDRHALRRGFLVLYPNQPVRLHPQRCWRWYEEANQRREGGEAAQLVAMIRDVMAERSVDPDRVYLSGISAGGAMALVLAATHPEMFAAVASHSGVAYGAARDQGGALAAMAGKGPGEDTLAARLLRAVERAGTGPDALPPLQVIHGSGDQAVHPSNARAIARTWASAATADAEPTTGGSGVGGDAREAGRDVTVATWKRDGEPFVELLVIRGLGHAWSGGDPEGSYTDPKGPSATRRVLSFFSRVGGDGLVSPEGSGTGGSGAGSIRP